VSSVGFDEFVSEVRNFYNIYNELPKQSGIRENGNEKRLGSFINRQRQKIKRGELSSVHALLLLETQPGFHWIHASRNVAMCLNDQQQLMTEGQIVS